VSLLPAAGLIALWSLFCSLAALAQEAPRQVQFGSARIEEGVRVVPVEIDQIEGVLAIDLDIVLNRAHGQVLDVRSTDLLADFFTLHNAVEDTLKIASASALAAGPGGGAFVEIVLEDTGVVPELLFLEVLLNDEEIAVEYGPRYATITAVLEESVPPDVSYLKQNVPNPFNGETLLVFSLAEPIYVELSVYNAIGQQVRTLLQQPLSAGLHRVTWDGIDGRGRRLSSGRYVAVLRSQAFARSIGMVLVE
jgi:hypothetical protein